MFKVGDRVRLRQAGNFNTKIGDTGTVWDIACGEDGYGIKFDRNIGGNTLGLGGKNCPSGYGSYRSSDELELIKEATPMIKKGDKVKVFDGSWARIIRNNKLEPTSGLALCDRVWKVIEAGMVLPGIPNDVDRINDLVLEAEDNGQIVFICSAFVKPYTPPEKCPHCPYCNRQ